MSYGFATMGYSSHPTFCSHCGNISVFNGETFEFLRDRARTHNYCQSELDAAASARAKVVEAQRLNSKRQCAVCGSHYHSFVSTGARIWVEHEELAPGKTTHESCQANPIA
jgi:hypothetical protein